MTHILYDDASEAREALGHFAHAGRGLWIGLHPSEAMFDVGVSGDLTLETDLHCTVVHLGPRAFRLTGDAIRVVSDRAQFLQTLAPWFDGVARFSGRDSDPVVALLRHPLLGWLRQTVMEQLDLTPTTAVPHLTVGRAAHGADVTLRKVRLAPGWLTLTHLSATCGEARYQRPLAGVTAWTADEF